MKTWFITGISSGIGLSLCRKLLERQETVAGTVLPSEMNKTPEIAELLCTHGGRLMVESLDLCEARAVREVTDRVFAAFGRVDVIVSNAGCGCFGAAEENSDKEVQRVIDVNLIGSIRLIRAALPHLRAQSGGRIIQMSSYGGLVAFAGTSVYHAAKFGIEGFCEALAQEMEPFNIGITLIEPGGTRTGFRARGVRPTEYIAAYDGTPAHAVFERVNAQTDSSPCNPEAVAEGIIASADVEKAPLRLIFGSQAYCGVVETLSERLARAIEQKESAVAADYQQ